MTQKEFDYLCRDDNVCHDKYNHIYRVVSKKCRFKDSANNWTDSVIYAPLCQNEYEMFDREQKSFIEEFSVIPKKYSVHYKDENGTQQTDEIIAQNITELRDILSADKKYKEIISKYL